MAKRDASKIKADMQKARTLIKNGNYERARRVLKSVDHPKAKQWLEQIDQIDSSQKKKSNPLTNLLRFAVIAFVGVCGLIFILILFVPSDETTPVQEITDTPEPTQRPAFDTSSTMLEIDAQATETSLQDSLSIFQGVEAIFVFEITYDSSDVPMIYAEIVVSRAADKTSLANDLLEYSTILMGIDEFASVSMILDAGTTAVVYTLDADNDWIITTLDEFNAERAATRAARPTNTPRPTRRPTQRPSSSSSSGSSTTRNPSNCDEAIAMGMTAEEAAQAGLDRDGDGVACYGD